MPTSHGARSAGVAVVEPEVGHVRQPRRSRRQAPGELSASQRRDGRPGAGGEGVVAAQRPAPGRRVERHPPLSGEPDLDPRVGVVVGDDPGVAVTRAAREPHGDARGDPEQSEHQCHRAGEVLAVPGFRPCHEGDERRAGRAGRRLVVAEPSCLPEPRLERQHGSVLRRRPAGHAVRDLVERALPAVAEVRRIAQERLHRLLALRSREAGEDATVHLEEAGGGRGCPGRRRRKCTRSRVRRVAPHPVALTCPHGIADPQDAARELEDGSEAACIEPDRRAGRGEVVVDERLDLDGLLEPVRRLRGPRRHELRQLQRTASRRRPDRARRDPRSSGCWTRDRASSSASSSARSAPRRGGRRFSSAGT